jgi:pimeloyl-ACP methyl ester carboxylesterase
MTRFLLVHGAWHGGWCFDALARALEERGHEVEAPDLPMDRPPADVNRYADLLAPHAEAAVVVGHSLGGVTIPFVAERAPVERLVFLAALLPEIGGRREDAPRPLLPTFTQHIARREDGRSWWPDFEVAREHLFRDCSEDVARWAWQRLRPQVPLEWGELETLAAPVATIVCRNDVAVSPEWSRWAARELLHVEPVEVDAGHFPMLTQPTELAGVLEALA